MPPCAHTLSHFLIEGHETHCILRIVLCLYGADAILELMRNSKELNCRQKKKPTFVSLYTGAGGLDLGFIAAGFEPIFSNDIAYDAMQTYSATMQILEKQGILRRPHEIVTNDIRKVEILPARNSADLVIGGPPCQGFSVAGKMDPNDPRSRHVFDFLAMVERVQPKAFVMENVKALAVNKRWHKIIDNICKQASELGYDVSLNVLNAAHYGVPQARERMILIGTKQGVCPKPKELEETCPTVRDTLKSLPPLGSPGNSLICKAKITAAIKPVLRQSPWAGMLFNGQGRPMNLDMPAPTLPASMGGNRTPIVDQESLEHNKDSWVCEYHKKLMNGGPVAKTVPNRLRRISVNEAAALQTFPVNMPWFGAQSSIYRQIGNAVPPLLAYHVAKNLADFLQLDNEQYPQILNKL